jgi:phosphatidylglycerol:prolipoprotein diacylglycerol transferase
MDALAEPVRQVSSTLVYVLAYAVGLALFAWLARRRGIATSGVRYCLAWGVAGGIVGATVLQLVAGDEGRTIIGGVAGGYIAVIIAKRRIGLKRPLGDLFAFALAGGEAVGRWGCFLAGCCYGKVANVPWAIEDHGAFRHPTQIYSSLAAAAILALLFVLERRKKLPENALFYIQGALFCSARFIIEFYRQPARVETPLTLAQWACLAGFILFTTLLVRMSMPASRALLRPFAAAR